VTEEIDADAAARYVRWIVLRGKDIPIVLLIGGTTGTGKSTVATQVAHRFGITRVTSTDTIRQVMRAFFSEELLPVLHHSSFDAGSSVGAPADTAASLELLGFSEQARQVCVGTQAVIDRAERERISTVVEGVHVLPGLLHHLDAPRCAIVEAVMAVRNEDEHRSHFAMRNTQTAGLRPSEHYLRHFDEIRHIQDFIVAQAYRQGVPVIENTLVDTTVQQLVDHTLDVIERVDADSERATFPAEVVQSV